MNKVLLNQIRTEAEIETIVAKVPGTWVKRRNTRKKLIDASNTLILNKIEEVKKQIRLLRSRPECEKRNFYSQITKLELQKI